MEGIKSPLQPPLPYLPSLHSKQTPGKLRQLLWPDYCPSFNPHKRMTQTRNHISFSVSIQTKLAENTHPPVKAGNQKTLLPVCSYSAPADSWSLFCLSIGSIYIACRVTGVIQFVSHRRHLPWPAFTQRGGSLHRPLSTAAGMHWGQLLSWPHCC